nr:zinc finger MYM-type protein 1-like [Hydra vulgaris]
MREGENVAHVLSDTSTRDFGLNISFCRGQGYDNGANMKGKKIGLQKRILDLNPLAFYLPCGSHSLDLVIYDAVTFGFKQATVDPKELAEELNIDAIFKPLKRVRRVKRHYDENAADEPIQNPEKKLEVTFLNPLLDTCLSSINERFEQLNEYVNIWSFLFNLDNLPIKNELFKLCKQLQEKLTVNTKSEIDGTLLCDELISLYSNTWIVLRILLTIPVTVASGERSFSKLKLIKTYLRNTMLQDRLNSLSMLSIEQDIAENLNFSTSIQDGPLGA